MSKQRQKGTLAETALVNYYRQWWPECGRNPLAGNKDIGDIRGLPWPIEVKNCKTYDLAGWSREAAVEAENAGAPFAPVVFKPNRVTDPAEYFVLVRNWMHVEMALAYEAQN